jgi:Kef-type K+ transport system membrane component KefB
VSHLLQLVLLLIVVLGASKLAGLFAQRVGQPAVVGSIAAGLLLGPSLLDIMSWHIGSFYLFGYPSFDHLQDHFFLAKPLLSTLSDIAELGVLLLMFIAGMETDLAKLRAVGKVALWAAIGGVLAPMLSALLAGLGFSATGLPFSTYTFLFIAVVLTATSVSISAETLMELGKLRSREGSTILGAAVIDDVIGVIVLSLVVAFKPPGIGMHSGPEKLSDWLVLALNKAGLQGTAADVVHVALILMLMAAFFWMAMRARPLLMRTVDGLRDSQLSQGLLSGVLLATLLYSFAAEWIGGLAAITGAYLCGVLLGQSEQTEDIESKLHTLAYGFFVPVFFVSIGMQANVRPVFTGATQGGGWLLLAFTIVIIALAILGKVGGCWLGAKLTGFTSQEAYRVGVGMISRGEVGIIVALVGLRAGIIDEMIFSIMVLMVLVTTLVTPIWLKRVFAEPASGTGAISGSPTIPA